MIPLVGSADDESPDTRTDDESADASRTAGESSVRTRADGGPPVTAEDERTGRAWRRRLAVVLAVGLVPWAVQRFATGELFLRFAWGGMSFRPAVTVTPLWVYPVGASVPLLSRWLVASLCWLAAVGSVLAGRVNREDPRLTAGLLVLAGVSNLFVSTSFARQPRRTSVAVGTVVALVAAGWLLRPDTVGRLGRRLLAVVRRPLAALRRLHRR